MSSIVPHAGKAPLARTRRVVARARHAGEIRVFALGFGHDRFVVAEHRGWDRLVCARAGAGVVRHGNRIAVVDSVRAQWCGAAGKVEIEATGRLDVRVVYVRDRERAPSYVTLTPLARELIERIVERGWLDPERSPDARLLRVLDDEFEALAPLERPLGLCFPHDPRALQVAEACATHARIRSARELAAGVACSARTLERIFARETGFGVVAWQRRFRLLAAAAFVASNGSVTDAGFDAGYAGTSAFVTAFRRAFGASPLRAMR